MILVSDEMLERILARAREVAEEQWRRMVFDTGMNIKDPKALQLILDALAERYVENVARRANEVVDAKEAREATRKRKSPS